MTTTTASIAISINIKGVKSLSLIVTAGSGGIGSQDNADWALAELHA